MADVKETIRTPIGQARGTGSARHGAGHWWAQRVTSVLLVPVTLYILFHVGRFLPDPYSLNTLIIEIGRPSMAIALILGVAIGFYHAWLGVQTVLEDYVHHEYIKYASVLGNLMYFLFLGAACVFAVMYIVFAQMAQMGR